MICEYLFRPRRRLGPKARHEFAIIVEDVLIAWLHAGQICGDYLMTWNDNAVRVFARAPELRSVQLPPLSEWQRRTRERLEVDLSGSIEVRAAGQQRPTPPRLRDQESLYLFTHLADPWSPVCAGTDGRPIPLYRLPISSEQRSELVFWADAYRRYDHLQLQCGHLEMPAYREMAEVGSELSREGREHCADLEAATGLPTYYFLHRYFAHAKGEPDRLCPGCGRRWRRRLTAAPFRGLGGFEFRCDGCRLVGQQGVSCEGERRARIGAFRPPR